MTAKRNISFSLNGKPAQARVEPRRSLVDCLRHDLGQTGTHVGCEHGVCGACTVIVNGQAVRACLMLAVQAEDQEVTTVEGLADDEALSPLQQSFHMHHALQCGFCTAGILMSAHALLETQPDADRDVITELVAGHLCRCTGYLPIIDAILDARSAYAAYARARDTSPGAGE